LILESLTRSRCSPAQALAAIGDCAELDFVSARRRLELAIRRSALVPLCAEVAGALAQLQKAFEKTITSGFYAVEANGHDPWERSRMLFAGATTDAWFDNLNVVIAARKILCGQFPSVDEEAFEVRQRSVDSFVKLYRLRRPR
jgi:hypothetical protein